MVTCAMGQHAPPVSRVGSQRVAMAETLCVSVVMVTTGMVECASQVCVFKSTSVLLHITVFISEQRG